MSDLDAALLAAHEAEDAEALVKLYAQAASDAAARGDVDAEGFYLTHAMVFALEANHADAPALRDRLVAAGREVPLHLPKPPKR